MKELIKITTNDEGQQLVSARELYLGLGLDKSHWKRWSKQNIETNEFFKENVDWIGFATMANGNEINDYAITIEFAKHIAMMARTAKSHEYRNYFIECEKIAKSETSANKHISDTDGAKSQIDLLTVTSKLLNLNDSSKLLLATKIYKDYNIPTTYLPTYTDSRGILKSATELLKENNIPISTIKFNKIMIDKGYLIEVERTSGKDKSKIKKFKNLAKTEFGENQISPKNPKETQPMYYENKFLELLKELGIC